MGHKINDLSLSLSLWFLFTGTGLSTERIKVFSDLDKEIRATLDTPTVVGTVGEPPSHPNATLPQQDLTPKRRQKVHWCWWPPHMRRPSKILSNEFGYNNTVDATKTDDWDLIFGGYPHCGKTQKNKTWDWKMERGLNHHLNEKGWDTLKPHQVWFPCMGCKDSYCNKRGLCEITRELDPDSCYLLPNDLDRLKTRMESDRDQLWVLKRDSPTMHSHMGTGVSFIRNASQIPSAENLTDETYLVQPFVEQHMGSGNYHRRHEIRLYIAVTSTTPLRAYAYNEYWVNLALQKYNQTSSAEVPDVCTLDTHLHRKGCEQEGLTKEERCPSFAEFCSRYDLTNAQVDRFQESVRTLIGNILTTANPMISAHPVNNGITKSQASCFSFMRADLAVTTSGEAYLYEINEFPFSNQKETVAGRVQAQAYRDLFTMIGLDQPALPVEKRANYELSHLGGWIPLHATT